jgi:3-oxoacyl-[acyl-carrier-protein] synthase II
MNRVVITGLGAVTAIGHNVQEYWNGLTTGQNGVQAIDSFDVSQFSTRFAAQVRGLDFEAHFDKKEIRKTSRFILFALLAAQEAINDSGLQVALNPERVGVEIGSGIGGIEFLEDACNMIATRGPSRISPFTVPMMICDMAAGQVAMKTGAKGPNSCSVTACASSAHSMANGFSLIQRGLADAMIVGGSEACVTPLGLGSFCAARSLSTRNDDPLTASRPFDKDRDGFVMGEGAGILIFENYDHAKARGAKIYAEVVGFGSTGDAYHLTAPAPEGEGAQRAIKMALDMAKLSITDIDYINAHGTSTELNDKNETAAIKAVFGSHAYNLSVSSTKSMTGHLLGAAGAIELVASAKIIQDGIIPPTINCFTQDPDCDLNYTPNQAVKKEVSAIISNSFGFGGHNAVLAIKKLG